MWLTEWCRATSVDQPYVALGPSEISVGNLHGFSGLTLQTTRCEYRESQWFWVLSFTLCYPPKASSLIRTTACRSYWFKFLHLHCVIMIFLRPLYSIYFNVRLWVVSEWVGRIFLILNKNTRRGETIKKMNTTRALQCSSNPIRSNGFEAHPLCKLRHRGIKILDLH